MNGPRNGLYALAHAARKILYEMGNQGGDIFATFPEWRHHDGKNVQTVVEVTAEFVATQHFVQIAICCCNQSNADAVRPAASQALEFLFLQAAWPHSHGVLLSHIQERVSERVRIARDVHDTLLQTLQGSKLVADHALENSSDAEHARRSLESFGCEAIRNAFMHSHAMRIEVQLSYSEDFRLIVRDNGRGMDSTTASRGRDGHFGLQSMRERAERIGGQFQLITAPNLGTIIELKMAGKTAFGRGTSVWLKALSWLGGIRRSKFDLERTRQWWQK
jgi:signal transduction histidine kinase